MNGIGMAFCLMACAIGMRAEASCDSLETGMWQSAIDAAASRGGGVVNVPPGRHVTGQLYLKDNVELRLEEGAVLEGATGLRNYTFHALPWSEGTWSAVVMALGVTNVAVTGRGEIFGNGEAFDVVKTAGVCQEGFRPRGMFFSECRGVRLDGFLLRDAACWGIVFKCCDGVSIRNVRIDSHANRNNDGFDIEASNVLVEGCDVDAGDDAFCIKSNNPRFIVENVFVSNCVARSHCNGYKLGTASHGTMRNVRVVACRTEAPRRCNRGQPPLGIGAICVECVDGGIVEDVRFDGIEVGGFQVPIFIRGGDRRSRTCGIPPNDFRILRNVVVENVSGRAEGLVPSSITGVSRCRPADVVLRNVDIECIGEGSVAEPISEPGPEMAGVYPEATMFRQFRLPCYGLYVSQADDVRLENVRFSIRPGTVDERLPVHCGTDAKSMASRDG